MLKEQESKVTTFINKDFENIRLDRFLVKTTKLPYSLFFKLLRCGKVKVNNKKAKYNQVLKINDEVKCFFNVDSFIKQDSAQSATKVKDNLSKYKHILTNNIIYEDKDYLVVNKPENIASQGGTAIKISMDELLKSYSKTPAFLCHRIDKKTSGLLLSAKNHKALTYLIDLFKNNLVSKTYLALVQGKIFHNKGTITEPLIKSNNSKRQLVVIDNKRGKKAITDYKIIASSKRGNFHLLELKPHTGRTHQIRVHLAKVLNCPIVGDYKYGYKDSSLLFKNSREIFTKDSLFLHAFKVDFTNYNSDFLFFEAPLSDKWQHVLKHLDIKL